MKGEVKFFENTKYKFYWGGGGCVGGRVGGVRLGLSG